MNEFANQAVILTVGLAAMWMVVVGIAVMVRGPQTGITVLLWPIRAGFRLVRRAIGGGLIALGQFVRGGGPAGNQRNRRRH